MLLATIHGVPATWTRSSEFSGPQTKPRLPGGLQGSAATAGRVLPIAIIVMIDGPHERKI
jgi:hypothetical protein